MKNQALEAASRGGVAIASTLFWCLRRYALLAFTLLAPALVSEAASATVLVASVSGEVKALSLDDEFEVTLGKDFLGREISVNSVVTTGKGGTAALLFSNGVVVNLQPNSRLYIRKFVQAEFSTDGIDLTDLEVEPSTSQLEFHLDFGNLVVKAPKLAKGSSMRLTSPLGTAGIRGTIFQLVVVRNPETGTISGGLNLLSGELEFSDLSGNVTLLASGEGMQLASNRLGVQAPAVAGEIADLASLYVATAPIGRPDIRLPGEASTVLPEESVEEEPPAPPVPMSIQEIASMILFALEEAEEAVSNFTLDMFENPLSVADAVSGVETPSSPAFTTSGMDLFVDQAPTVNLLGDSVTKVDLSESFTDLGVSVVDFLGNDITSDVTVTGSIDVNVAGTYPLTYVVSDLRGFQSSVTRTVMVGDFTAPTVSLNDDDPLTHEAGTAFTDPGATAFDILAGQTTDVTSSIAANFNFDGETSPPGTYSIIYVATDDAGNQATVARTVTIVDTTAPVITLINPFLGGDGFDPMFIDLGTASAYADPGATALDSFDGDITTSIVINDGAQTALNQETVGEFSIRYDVSDEAGNSASAYRYVTVIGNEGDPPDIRLAGKDSNTNPAHDPDPDNAEWKLADVNTATLEVGTAWADYGYKAFKKQGNKTFDYTDEVVVSGFVNTATLGTYTLTYTVRDEYLNESSTTREVTVVDTTAPSITPNVSNGLTDLTLEGGSTYTDLGATAFDTYEGDLTSAVVTTGADFSTTTVGAHFVTYSVEDRSGNEANASRQITVVDTTSPTITLLDSTTGLAYSGLALEHVDQDLTNSLTYTDPGFTATDLVDGDVSGAVQISGSVDLQTVGTYTLTYSVTDAAGNVSSAHTRTVYVLDKDKPLISLNISPQSIELGGIFVHETATAVDNVDGDLSASISVRIVKDPDGTPVEVFPSGNQLSVNSSHIDASRTDVTDLSNVGTYEFTYNVSDNAVDADSNPAPNAADPVVRRVVVSDTLVPVIPSLGTMKVDGQTLDSPQPVFDLDEAVSDMRTNLVYDTRGDGNSDYFNLDSSSPGNHLAKLTVTLYDLDNTEIALNAGTGSFAKDIKENSGEYTIKYKITDYSGNESSEVTRIIDVDDQTPPTLTLYGSNPIHDFFRYDSSSDGTTATHPISGDTVGISGFNPSLSPLLMGEHDFILAAYNFTDPGVYAEDNKDWLSASQNPPGSYPDSDGDGNGELHFIEDISSQPSSTLANWDRIYRYSEVASKTLKEWQEAMDEPTSSGSVSNANVPDSSSNFLDTGKASGNNENIVQLTIYYYVRDEAGNQAEATRTVYLYESFKFGDYAFYATPLTDNLGVDFVPFGDSWDDQNRTEPTDGAVAEGYFGAGIGTRRTDMDADGLSDYWEEKAGTDPKRIYSLDNGIPNTDDDLTRFKRWVDDPANTNKTPLDPFSSL